MQIKLAQSEKEIEDCFPIMVQLRPQLSKEEFVSRAKRQRQQGYQLVFIKDKDKIVSVAGFRILENLVSGKFLCIDDFVTDEQMRSQGFGDALIDWLVAFAKREKCTSLQLDSGVERMTAHRFYFKKRMGIYAYHFVLPLQEI